MIKLPALIMLIKNVKSYELWQALSGALQEKVTKKNFRSILERLDPPEPVDHGREARSPANKLIAHRSSPP